MVKLVGFKHKKGNFTDSKGEEVNYDYIALYFTSNEVEVDAGDFAGIAKAKPQEFKLQGAKTLADAVGKEVILVPDLTNPKYIKRVLVV